MNKPEDGKNETTKNTGDTPDGVPAITAKSHLHQHNSMDERDQSNDAEDKHKPSEVRMNFIQRWWHFVKDTTHAGAVTAIFTVVIAFTGIVYAVFACLQWTTMSGQLNEMKSSSALQKKTAAVQFGLPLISINWLGMFELRENKAPHFIVRIQNNGKTNAESVSFAMGIKFGDQRPEPHFAPKDFQPIRPGTVEQWDPIKKNYIQSERQYAHTLPGDYSAYKSGKTRLYMWGVVRYKDFTNLPNEWDQFTFCRYVTADVVQISTDEAQGYSGPYQDCDEK
jgi:hypothetical protein